MARERYLLGSEEEAINKPGAEIKANTKKAKWENFWFYHKWHVVIAIIVCAIVVGFVHDMVSKVNPDYQIGLLTQQTFPTEVIDDMQKQIAKSCKDLNGDGKVVVQINSYVIASDANSSKTDVNQQMASVTRFSADLSSGESMIFLSDDTSFTNKQKTNSMFSYLDGTTPKTDATDYDKMRVAWDKCKVLSKYKFSTQDLSQSDVQKILSELTISMRVPSSDKKQKDYYDQSKALFNKLVYDK